MRTVQFLSVYNDSVRMTGRDPATWNATDAQKAALCLDLNRVLRRAWDYAWWNELMLIEERTVVTASSVKYVPLSATDKSDIGTCESVATRNPRTSALPGYLSWWAGDLGIILSPLASASAVWVRFRGQVPTFTITTAYSASGSYVTGDVVYYATTGECYKALASLSDPVPAPTDTDNWALLEFPWIFKDFVPLAVSARYLVSDGQREKAHAEMALAFDEQVALSESGEAAPTSAEVRVG